MIFTLGILVLIIIFVSIVIRMFYVIGGANYRF